MTLNPDKPGQILTDAEKHGKLLKLIKKIGHIASANISLQLPIVKIAVEEAKRIEEEKIRERIVCGGNRLS